MNRGFSDKKLWLLSLVLVIVAALPHVRYEANGLTLDEAEYALAARKGFVANWLDADGTREQRHFHGPLLTHAIHLCVLLFGESDFVVQLPSRIFGLLVPLTILWGCATIFPAGLRAGAVAAFSLAIMPTFVQVCGVANMHAMATFFIVLSFFLTIKMIESDKKRYLYLQAIVLGLLFSTIEYGIIIFGIIGLVLLLKKNPYFHITFRKITVSKHIIYAALVVIVTIGLVWIAGVVKLNFLRNLLYYLRYSEHGHPIWFNGQLTRHVPWWAYIVWFMDIAPAWLLLSLFGVATLTVHLYRSKFSTIYVILFLFLFILLAALFRQHIMSARYAIYVIPFLTLSGAIFLHMLTNRWRRAGVVLIAAALVVQAGTNLKMLADFSQGDPGYKQAASFIKNNARTSDRILAWYAPILRYYLDGFGKIYNYNLGPADPELLQKIERGYFRYIIYYHNQLRRWPDDPGYTRVKKDFILRYTFRKEKEYLWLYEYSPVLHRDAHQGENKHDENATVSALRL